MAWGLDPKLDTPGSSARMLEAATRRPHIDSMPDSVRDPWYIRVGCRQSKGKT